MTTHTYIDRFRIDRKLGRGAQGVVYLATDPRLERQVAIKTVHMNTAGRQNGQERLLQEARTISKLKHPNIVSLYEANEYQGLMYLVFEFVEGRSLKDELKKKGPFPQSRCIDLMRQILAGISVAHQKGIIHRDLTPANIMIDANGVPHIMDFGISVILGTQKNIPHEVSGTPCYMSPEHFSDLPLGPHSDIFSLGLILYEMLLGRAAIQADSKMSAMYKIANQEIPPPSAGNPAIDAQLDRIVLKAVARQQEMRYHSAAEMQQDLEGQGATPESAPPEAADTHGVLDFLLRKIRHKGDFPAFSQHIMEINRMASSSRANVASASDLANAVLKNYSLTSKILRLVNSAFYGQFAGSITTVSRAVVVLGFEQVRMAASSLMLFEHMKSKSQSVELQDAAVSSFMSGMFAKDLAEQAGMKGAEEAFICGMLHNLGRYLVLFYLPEEYRQIENQMARQGESEEKASRAVLGLSMEEIGVGVARAWGFPLKITGSMEALPPGKIGKAKSETELMRNLAGFSSQLCNITMLQGGGRKSAQLTDLIGRFEDSLPVSEKRLTKLVDGVVEKVEEHSEILNIDLKQSRAMQRLIESTHDPEAAPEAQGQAGKKASSESPFGSDGLEIQESEPDWNHPPEAENMLIDGIKDITNTLVGEYALQDVMTMILEIVFRAFALNRVLFFLTEGGGRQMRVRFGFGNDIESLVGKLRFALGDPKDVFNLAISLDKDVSIHDTNDPKIKRRIPDWFYRDLPALAFMLFPVTINRKPFGMLYMDRDQKGQVVEEKYLNYIKTLRSQAVLAVKQKHG